MCVCNMKTIRLTVSEILSRNKIMAARTANLKNMFRTSPYHGEYDCKIKIISDLRFLRPQKILICGGDIDFP